MLAHCEQMVSMVHSQVCTRTDTHSSSTLDGAIRYGCRSVAEGRLKIYGWNSPWQRHDNGLDYTEWPIKSERDFAGFLSNIYELNGFIKIKMATAI